MQEVGGEGTNTEAEIIFRIYIKCYSFFFFFIFMHIILICMIVNNKGIDLFDLF